MATTTDDHQHGQEYNPMSAHADVSVLGLQPATTQLQLPEQSRPPPPQQQQHSQRLYQQYKQHLNSSSVSRNSDARSVYSSATSNTRRLIVFATPAKYSPLICFLMAIPLLAIVISIISLHPRRIDYRNSSTAWILGWTLLLVLILYMAILPKQIDVRCNGTVGIKTFLLTFHIDDVVRAYQAGIGREDFLRPRIRFGTSGFDGRVVLRRSHGKWDVVVSPKDIDGFLKSVDEMIKEHNSGGDEEDQQEHGGGNENCPIDVENNIIIVPRKVQKGEGKPDLSSTDHNDYLVVI
jgi:hypothetical protein